ncbi:GNAT family N-acetyltransferase [Chachezhania sediminis]|uniref:GNAT family N-acetyltransferase n=1 Tax=Chachezhania sediminis TaxID=2599291 RepID=UPI0018EED0CF|nr:GNAT family N-acetyltransferase [Chachezhania sediminis]
MGGIVVRAAEARDAEAMSLVLTPILARWGSARAGDAATVMAQYVAHPDRLACSVAVGDGVVLGFQSLKRATAGNPYGLAPGWGIIGTYVDAAAAGRGVGRTLFAASRAAAEAEGLIAIDATIGRGNAEGQAYYEAMGFRAYRETATAIAKRFDLTV